MAEPETACADCGGAAHPASGCQYSERTVICGRCVRRVWAWIAAHTNGKGRKRGMLFYDHVSVARSGLCRAGARGTGSG